METNDKTVDENTEHISEYEEWVQKGNKKAEEIMENTVAG